MTRILRAALLGLIGCLSLWASAKEAAKDTGTVAADIAYIAGSNDDAHKLDVYHAGSASAKGRPVVIYVHGGGWGRGDKRMAKSLAPIYVEREMVFVSLNYSLAPKNKYPSFLNDLAAAIRWTKDNIARYGGDPDRLVLVGHSAGAHLVALLGTDPQFLKAQGLPLNVFKAVVPVDTASFNFLVDPYGWFVGRQKKIREDAFGTDKAVYAAASPTLVVAKAKPDTVSPFHIFVSGKRDDAQEQSEAFATAIRQSGNKATVTSIDLGHARMNQAIGDRDSPLARKVLEVLNSR
jgi:arylformamidase